MSTSASESVDAGSDTQSGTDLLAGLSGDLIVVNPTPTTIRELVDSSEDLSDQDTVRVIANESTLKDVRNDFLLSARLKQLIADDLVDVRAHEDVLPLSTIVVSEEEIVAVLETPSGTLRMENGDDEVANTTYLSYGDVWDDGVEFNFRTPPLQQFRETFREEFGEESEQDLFEVIQTVNSDPDFDNTDLNASIAALIVGAKHKHMLYDIGKWGEEIGVASKATFSRSKTNLENRGVVDTEKEPIDIGRPRLRLGLNSDEVEDDSVESLATLVEKHS